MKKFSMTTILSVIAAIAIIWYVFSNVHFFDYWYALPIISLITGVCSFIIPRIEKKLKQINSIIATGLAIMAFFIFSNFVPKDKNWIAQLIIIAGLSIFIDIYSWATFHIADSIFNVAIAAITVWLLSQTNYWLLTLIILEINFLVVLTINFHFRFYIKSEKKNREIHSNSNNKSE